MEDMDKVLDTLRGLEWGADLGPLAAIDQMIADAQGKAEATAELEKAMLSVLGSASAAGRDFICRRLVSVGSAACVPTLSGMLTQAETSHMARLALEAVGAPEAAAALRTAAESATGTPKIGLMGSLAKLKDGGSVTMLAAATKAADATISHAAIWCLGQIGGAEAVAALSGITANDDATKLAVADALLLCADRLLAEGNNAGARDLYRKYTGEAQPKQVRLAANKGVLASVRR
ncbi:MAG: hypothetical protein JNL67_02935 [Planctomycetaceae bacterium]|nr:hypothetical protein [Planctomycetaceae bacterium]